MVSQMQRIGLASIVPAGTVIVHSSIIGRRSFGRISDLLSAWLISEFDLKAPAIASFRMLTSALLEALPRRDGASTHIEMAVFDGQIVIAARAECGLEVDSVNVERSFTQFWLHANETQIFKRVIHPADRIEVRYQEKTRIAEWRVFRKMSESVEADASGSFSVIEDGRDKLEQEEAQYLDLGDLPYRTWLEDVYRSANRASSSGDLVLADGGSQGEEEIIRMKVRNEIGEIERKVQSSQKAGVEAQGESSNPAVAGSAGPTGDAVTVVKGQRNGTEEDQRTVVPAGASAVEESFRRVIEGIRKEETVEEEVVRALEVLKTESLRNAENAEQFLARNRQFEELLAKKEKLLLRKDADIANLAEKHQREMERLAQEQKSNPFRAKAIEMFERVRELQEEKQGLEKLVQKLRKANADALAQATRETNEIAEKEVAPEAEEPSGTASLTEDLEKKIDRLRRALEAEKAKTKSFLDRALAAEKEAQSSAPIISDLEAKVEHVLKTSLQYKKDIDAMKLKLVQAEQEKNKIKNELLNAQAQIKTLQRRQAA